MSSINKIGTALTIVFAVSLMVLIVEILYVLWRRRLFLRRSNSAAGDGTETYSQSPQSMELLLYYFCWKNVQNSTRVEPELASREAEAPQLPTAPPEKAEDDVLKWHAMYGPSRVLFTIKEEEKEEMELAGENIININDNNIVNIIEINDDIELLDATPFSTPCDSPPYYTPSQSPTRKYEDAVVFRQGEEIDSVLFSGIEVSA